MTDELDKALVHRPATGLVGSEKRTNPVIARMTQDLLVRAQASGLSRARFRIGDYVLREPDYRQILLWADALGMAPETVLAVLAETRKEPGWHNHYEPITFAVEDGAIVSLAWDFYRLPTIPEPWLPGLLIRTLGFIYNWPDVGTVLRPILPRLKTLVCEAKGLESVDLSQVPELTKLYCSGTQLTMLDLNAINLSLTGSACSSDGSPGVSRVSCCGGRSGLV